MSQTEISPIKAHNLEKAGNYYDEDDEALLFKENPYNSNDRNHFRARENLPRDENAYEKNIKN